MKSTWRSKPSQTYEIIKAWMVVSRGQAKSISMYDQREGRGEESDRGSTCNGGEKLQRSGFGERNMGQNTNGGQGPLRSVYPI